MPKMKCKRNIRNVLLQKLSEAIEYIDLSELNMPWKPNLILIFVLAFQLLL